MKFKKFYTLCQKRNYGFEKGHQWVNDDVCKSCNDCILIGGKIGCMFELPPDGNYGCEEEVPGM
jgi:hypothetical protein